MIRKKFLDLSSNYTLHKFCADVLKKRFPGDPVRQEINDSDADKLNFACPFCGDSQKDPNKKRGNLYLLTQTYKCYNDGCSAWVKLDKFIKEFALKYHLEIPELGEKKIEFKADVGANKKGFLIEFLINREVGKKLLSFDKIVERFSLIPCCLANEKSAVGQFIDRRMIRGLPVFEQSCYYDSREDKIYLFNLDLKSGCILGFAIRRIDDSASGPKYDIKNYSEFKRNGLVHEISDEFIQKVNSINNYFNILNIDFSKTITVTEGQIDSMFVRNCIATTGVTKSKQLLEKLVAKKNSRIFFDNDKAGREQSLALLNKGYTVFLWKKVEADLKKKHRNLKSEIESIKDVNDLFKFLAKAQPGLGFEEFNDYLDRNFSNDLLDLLLV